MTKFYDTVYSFERVRGYQFVKLYINVWEMAWVTAMAAGGEQTRSAHARDVTLGVYGLHGPRCPLSPKRLLNLITHLHLGFTPCFPLCSWNSAGENGDIFQCIFFLWKTFLRFAGTCLLCCNFFGQPGSVSKFPTFLWVKLWVGWVGRGYTEISWYFPASWINWVTLVTKIKLLYSLRF